MATLLPTPSRFKHLPGGGALAATVFPALFTSQARRLSKTTGQTGVWSAGPPQPPLPEWGGPPGNRRAAARAVTIVGTSTFAYDVAEQVLAQ